MAEISGGEFFLPEISTRASPFSPRTTLYGTIFISSLTSSYRRPMNRLIEKTVFSGLVMAWRFATCPTSRSPLLVNATTDGVVRAPSWFAMTVGWPASITATTELVVPRSITIIFPIGWFASLACLRDIAPPTGASPPPAHRAAGEGGFLVQDHY